MKFTRVSQKYKFPDSYRVWAVGFPECLWVYQQKSLFTEQRNTWALHLSTFASPAWCDRHLTSPSVHDSKMKFSSFISRGEAFLLHSQVQRHRQLTRAENRGRSCRPELAYRPVRLQIRHLLLASDVYHSQHPAPRATAGIHSICTKQGDSWSLISPAVVTYRPTAFLNKASQEYNYANGQNGSWYFYRDIGQLWLM